MYDTPINYRYLNMDTEQFHETETDLLKFFWKRNLTATKQVIMSNPIHNQGLIAIGSKRDDFGQSFSECAAMLTCRRIS